MNLEDDQFFRDTEGFPNIISPNQDSQNHYYEEYCRLYLANFVLTSQVNKG